MMPGEELIVVADSGPAAKDAAFSEPFGKAPEPLYELPLGPHTEHMAKGVAAALRSLMRSCADPDGWLPPLLDEQRCARTPLPWPYPLSPIARPSPRRVPTSSAPPL